MATGRLTIRLDNKIGSKLAKLAKQRGETESEIAHSALESFVEAQEQMLGAHAGRAAAAGIIRQPKTVVAKCEMQAEHAVDCIGGHAHGKNPSLPAAN